MTPDDRGPRAKITRLQRRADGLMVTFGLVDPRGAAGNAMSYAESHQRKHLEDLLASIGQNYWQPVRDALAAEAQVRELRAEANRLERDMHVKLASLNQVKGNLRMPGVEKLALERRLTDEYGQIVQRINALVADAHELESRLGNYRGQVTQLCRKVASEAVQRAAKDLDAEAERFLAEWAGRLPATALFVGEAGGMAGTERMAAFLESTVRDLVKGQSAEPRSEHFDQQVGPEGEGSVDASEQCPSCRSPMHWSVRNARWHCIECGHVITPAGHVMEQGHPARPAYRNGGGVESAPAGEAIGEGRPIQFGPDGKVYEVPVPGRETTQQTMDRLERAYPDHKPTVLRSGPGSVDELLAAREPAPTTAGAFMPFHENWPPHDGDPDNPGYDGTPQPGGVDGADPLDPYTVAQAAAARAQQMLAAGQQARAPQSANATGQPATTAFDQTNGGWNGPPTPPESVNGTPFAPGEVDAALRQPNLFGTGGQGVNGPVVELGPNDMPLE